METKIKSCSDKVTEFYDKKNPKVDSTHTCLTVISLHFTLKKDENYYPQALNIDKGCEGSIWWPIEWHDIL